MVRLASLSLTLLLGLTLPGQFETSAADAPAGAARCRVSAPTAECRSNWTDGNRILIRAGNPDQDIHLEWQYDLAENRDLRITVTAARGTDAETGVVVLIENQAMLSRGLTLTPGQELDALGIPALSLQLVLDILELTIPDGPSSVIGPRRILAADDAVLKIATPGARGVIPAPWRVDGTVERISPARLSFDLTLAFRPIPEDADERVMTFAGYWEERPAHTVFSDATTIEGWAIHRIARKLDAGSGIAPNALQAMPIEASFATLGALRRYLLSGSSTARTAR